MLLRENREQLVEYAGRMAVDGLALGTSGNLSSRVGELVAITPSCIRYDELESASMCVVDRGGRQVEGPFPPSTELPMHLRIYDVTGAGAVVHTHSPFATAVATALDELPPVHYLAAELGGRVRTAPYATFGSEELAVGAAATLAEGFAVLLRGHGAVTIGDDLSGAYARSLVLEWLSALYCRARRLGEPATLPHEEIENVAGRLAKARAATRQSMVRDPATQGHRGVLGAAQPTSRRDTHAGSKGGTIRS